MGYQGIKTDDLSPEHIHIPHKKSRKSKQNPDPQLTRQQKRENRRIGRVRVLVEHAIGGMKVFHGLTIRLRNHLKHLADDFILATARLWNLKKFVCYSVCWFVLLMDNSSLSVSTAPYRGNREITRPTIFPLSYPSFQ